MSTANPIASTLSTVIKTTTGPTVAGVKHGTGSGIFVPKPLMAPDSTTLSNHSTPSPIAAPSTTHHGHGHVQTPMALLSTVHAPKTMTVPQPNPVGTHCRPPQATSQNQAAAKIMAVNRLALPEAHPASHPKGSPSSKSSKKKKAAVSMATAQSASCSGSAQGENTGRWTAEEHRLFLQGLEQHGKGWKKIASLIKSRTVVQIRTHAQKYFQKIAKARQNGEDGVVSMENRERVIVSNSAKRKRGGNKRKAISSVVASAAREGKKQATDNSNKVTGTEMVVPLPMVAPFLTPYVYPLCAPPTLHQEAEQDGIVTPTESMVPSITTAHGTISGAALEDSL